MYSLHTSRHTSLDTTGVSLGAVSKKFELRKCTLLGRVRGHAPPENFENLSCQECHFLHSESVSCYIYGIFIS